MSTLANIGHALLHLLVVLVVLAGLAAGGVYVIRAVVADHDKVVAQGVTIQAGADARYADTKAASDDGAQHAADIAQGARAQRAVDAKERQADQGQPIDVNADDIRAIWGEPAHANP